MFVIAFLDSSFLSFPEVNDLLIIYLTTQHKERMVYYALMTTLGSMSAGASRCTSLARKGGEAFLRKRFNPHYLERAMATFRRYGLLAILIPSILPPPMPFKVFVLAAGVAKVRPLDFIIAIAIGRGSATSAKACWRSTTATTPRTSCATTRTPWPSAVAVAALVLGGGWISWRRRKERPAV